MKIVKFLLSLSALIGAIYFLNNPILLKEPLSDDPTKFKEVTVPPLGSFFSPFSGFWQNAESAGDLVSVKIEVPDMKGKVKIVFDERLVPHIFAENMQDAVFAQGYVVAKMRLFQMDLISRAAGGRLAEIIGEPGLENDLLKRRQGMAHGAELAVASWKQDPEALALMDAYNAGVNKYISELQPKDFPIEYKLMGFKPEPWNLFKSALVKKYMDQTLCFGEDDLEASNALKILGNDLFQKLYPEVDPKESPVIPAGTPWNFTPAKPNVKPAIQEAIGLIHHKVYEKERGVLGSNNWAVSGSKTLSGKPILANDPHLKLTLPSIWFEIQIITPDVNFYGVSVPGIPGVLIGFNEDIAWGETNVGQDVNDWYQITWTDKAKTSYQYDGGVKAAKIVMDSFRVKGRDTLVYDTVRWTEWGPVVYESNNEAWHDLAMHWMGHQPPNPKELLTFFGLGKSKNYDDYRQALVNYDYPAQNFVFASKNGDIGITANGLLPVKNKEQGRFLQDGSNSNNNWSGYIPKDQVPATKNPKRGFVASANQKSTDETYPYYYNSPYFDYYRGRYLNKRLAEMDSITAEDMMKLQNENYSIHAAEGMAALLKQLDSTQLDNIQKAVLAKMRNWDFRFDKDKVEPVVFLTWWEKFYEMSFDEVFIWKDSLPMLMPEKWRVIDLATNSPNDLIFDDKKTPERETAKNMATASFKAATKALADDLLKPDFNWSSYKKTSIMHLARIPAFSKMDLPVGGYGQALNAISGTNGPSWRMVVELGEEVKAWGVFPGGQSGNPGSPFYTTGLDKWMAGEYNELFFMKNAADNRQKQFFTIEIN
ncbi:MAG: penicillin acylase family protein [Saprospiraceae bacterium]|nr:penicillin acylase family protein [Saprospiraceae bacterium]MCF8248403.1 penicillin acylase family protein [Saprospiraceae bacterium]MCF8280074.1 penicillin acylase family protein [Bacteroidales bacterium]MCF8309931.1 penicillin acylase family protein [Saprospiraceae bacterium]MCF8438738.1 penicillin acylase family protein [Saprospiraceae bacterium]